MRTLRFFISLTMIIMVTAGFAQTDGDKLFIEGQTYQQTMTVSSQREAIKKFNAAKVVYTTDEKKTMCDNQVKICYNNINTIRKKQEAENEVKRQEEEAEKAKQEQEAAAQAAPEPAPRTDVELKLSESRLDFKYKPKEGATQSVEVTCNYDDWEIKSQPDWVTIYTAAAKFSVEAAENTTEDERSGVITVSCGDKDVDLVVNQGKASKLQKIKNIIKK